MLSVAAVGNVLRVKYQVRMGNIPGTIGVEPEPVRVPFVL